MPPHTTDRARSGAVSLAACLAAFATMAATSCTTTAPPAGDMPVQINFEARVGAKPAKCGESYAGVGASGATILLQDFRLYVSDAKLITKVGSEVPVTLTQWDFGFLKGLYSSPNNLYAPSQRTEIGRVIEQELDDDDAPRR